MGGVLRYKRLMGMCAKFRDTIPLDITGVSVPSSEGGNTFNWIIEDLEKMG